MSNVSVELASHAKLNLLLDLLSKRSDGYHEVEFIMQELALHDTLEFTRAKDVQLACNDARVYCDERNLILQAVQRARKECNVQEGVHIQLEKSIPMVGGLGGSSSNAATTLKALNELWKLRLNDAALIALAGSIGTDCCF